MINDDYDYPLSDSLFLDIEGDMSQLLQEFMSWIYSSLEKHYDYLISDESIAESLISNAYEFDEHGTMH